MEKTKKVYESKKFYYLKYNKENISVQLNRELIEELKLTLSDQSVKSYIEDLIKNSIKD